MILQWWKKTHSRFHGWLSLALCLAILVSSGPTAGLAAGRMAATSWRVQIFAASFAPGADQAGFHTPLAPAPPPDPDEDPTLGSMLGRVVNATDGQVLAGVQVVAAGVLDSFPLPLYLPLLLAQGTIAAPAQAIRVRAIPPAAIRRPGLLAAPPRATLSPLGNTATFTTTTDALGNYLFAIPAGDYTLTYTHAGYTPDERSRPVRANEVLRLDDIRLHPQDPVVTPLGSSGGVAQNSLGNSSLAFPAGALASQEAVRVTYVANPDLPGFFPDGSAPMGFSSFEPEGEVFPAGKEVLWTVEYTGTLPVGTDTLCYWWDGEEQRWRDPVPGKVVDLGGGKKALQAKVPHFSFYGHAVPGIAGQQPGQAGDPTVTTANAGQGPSGFT